jgi:hypothetical protein
MSAPADSDDIGMWAWLDMEGTPSPLLPPRFPWKTETDRLRVVQKLLGDEQSFLMGWHAVALAASEWDTMHVLEGRAYQLRWSLRKTEAALASPLARDLDRVQALLEQAERDRYSAQRAAGGYAKSLANPAMEHNLVAATLKAREEAKTLRQRVQMDLSHLRYVMDCDAQGKTISGSLRIDPDSIKPEDRNPLNPPSKP